LGSADERTLVDLIVDQIEFADVVVLNKVGSAKGSDLDAARRIIRALNPDAEVIEADFGKVPLDKVLATGRFDFARAEQHPLWFKELNGFRDHVPETEEYGIRSFVYRARQPFVPERFQAFLDRDWPGVVRAKGFFWLATRPHHVGEMSQAGALVRVERRGLWWSSVPKSRWPDHPDWLATIEPYLDPVWGDRRQEIVFIGCHPMNEVRIRAELDACLVDAPSFHPERWKDLPDPFPAWQRATA
ncbi:GTP-binding protein, partial [Rhizobiaceae sp. 2RAB30]